MCKSDFPVFFSYNRCMLRKKPSPPLPGKRKWTQSFSLLLFLLFFSGFSFANRSPHPLHLMKKQQSAVVVDWQLDATVNGVEFYHAVVECGGRNVVFLKLNNKNGYKVNATWKEVFTTREGKELVGEQGQKKVLLSTGEIVETSCENINRKELVILPEQVHSAYVVSIAKFQYKDITVSRAG